MIDTHPVIRYAKLPLRFNPEAIQTEISTANKEWQPHLNTYHYSGLWTVLPLRSPGGSHENSIPDLIGHDEFRDTVYMEHFVSVKTLVSKLKCPIMAVRFLNLQAGAIIKEHRDNELAFEKGEARLHFPVITNPSVEFYCEDERIFLNEGEGWYLNANLSHRVSNNGDTDRIHLVVDCKVNDWLTQLINSSANIAYKKPVVDDNVRNMIKHLRYQNTEYSNNYADELELIIKKIELEDIEGENND